jgi:hypothetical protein
MKSAAFFAYADNYLIDVKFGIIMDVEASRAIRQAGGIRTVRLRREPQCPCANAAASFGACSVSAISLAAPTSATKSIRVRKCSARADVFRFIPKS